MKEIEIGSRVELVNSHQNCYYKYVEWINKYCPEWLPWFQSGKLYDDGTAGEVVCIAPFNKDFDICAVKTDTFIYLVKMEAIVSCNNFQVELL